MRLRVALPCVIAGFLAIGGCEKAPQSSFPTTPTAEELIALYDRAEKAVVNGDLETYAKLYDAEEFSLIQKNHSTAGKELTPEVLKNYAAYWHHAGDFKLIGMKTSGALARVEMWRDSPETDASGKPRVDFLLLLFKNTSNAWRLCRMGRIGCPKSDAGEPPKVTENDVPEPLRIP